MFKPFRELLIMNGLIAIAMINESSLDPRDWSRISDPRLQIYAANRLGTDINDYLSLAIKLADKSTADLFEKFILNKLNVDVSSFEAALVQTKDGLGLISMGSGLNKSSINLKQVALEITNVIESDGRYLVYQIAPSEEIPDYWLTGIKFHDRKSKPSWDSSVAGMEINANLLVDEDGRNKYQTFTLWLCEFSKPASVNSILRKSRSVKPKNYALSIVAEDRLL